jgi:hypothetical protein
VLDRDTLAQPRASDLGLYQLPETLLQRLIAGDADRPRGALTGLGASGTKRAWVADDGVERDDLAEVELLRLTCGAGDRAGTEIDGKSSLVEQSPVFADHGLQITSPWAASTSSTRELPT